MTRSAACFQKATDIVTRCITGETIIVPVRGHVADLESIYTLNEVGTAIWDRIDGRTLAHQIAEALGREYDVATAEAKQDTLDFLVALEAAGLIREAAGPIRACEESAG